MSNEGYVAACEALKSVSCHYEVANAIKEAYKDGCLDVVEEIGIDQDRVDVIFRVNDELFMIKLEYNSYNVVVVYDADIKGPLKAVEKTTTVYE